MQPAGRGGPPGRVWGAGLGVREALSGQSSPTSAPGLSQCWSWNQPRGLGLSPGGGPQPGQVRRARCLPPSLKEESLLSVYLH